MIWVDCCFQEERGNVGQVCALGLLVDGALVELGVFGPRVVHCIDVHHWKSNKEDFVCRLCQSAVLAVPACSFQVEPVHVDSLLGRRGDVFLELVGCVIVQHHTIQSPALVGSCHLLQSGRSGCEGEPCTVGCLCVAVHLHAYIPLGLYLSHGREESLWIEESSHPKCFGPALKYPCPELLISLQQLRVPEANGRRVPRYLCASTWSNIVIQAMPVVSLLLLHFVRYRLHNLPFPKEVELWHRRWRPKWCVASGKGYE